MSRAQHTPGPWFLHSDGTIRVQQERPGAYAEPLCYASPWREESYQGDDATDETMANGRLMAAAPELLDALRNLLGCGLANKIDHMDTGGQMAVSKVRAAIAKATGSA